jgi:PAS domain S-box-containing protein/diguanylate cyclase (GGDEF)-like protein
MDNITNNHIKVLLIEDSPVFAQKIQDMLAGAKIATFEVKVSDKLNSGLQHLSEGEIDVVLLDLNLPDSQRDDTLFKINIQVPGIPIVILTESDSEMHASKAVKEIAQDYLVKDQMNAALLARSILYAIESKRSEEKVKEIAKEWEETFNAISDLVSVQDKNFRIVKVNRSFADAFGTKPEELIGKLCYELIHGMDEFYPGCPHKKTMECGKPATFEIFEPHLGKYLEISASPIFNDKGEFVASTHIIKDITERKRVEHLKDEFLNMVSHELRTPLTTIREAVSQVLDGILGETTEAQREFLSICLEDVDRLTRIINELLDISKIEAKKLQIKREIVDIVKLAKGVISSFYPRIKEKGLEMKACFPEEVIEVYADKDKIIQVFTNLIGNAIKFTQAGYIEISVSDKEEEVECSVSDTGIGIAEEDLPKVFDKFQQFGRLEGPGEKGTGLGLSIAKGIVELHKGKIWVESKLNQGTKFTFTLPKYTLEDILYESIRERIALAEKEYKRFVLFLVRVDNYTEIKRDLGEEKAKSVFFKIWRGLENIIRKKGLVTRGEKNELAILVEVDEQNIPEMNVRLKRAVKESIFEIDQELKINFSYGYATYPDDGRECCDLLEKARTSLINEREQRLKKRIMIVDDEPMVVRSLRRLLEGFGYRNIIDAYNGEDALQKLEVEVPDLIILDMKMPHMSGYEVVGRLKENVETKDIPILIMSGYKVEEEKLNQYVKKKAIPIVSKPFDVLQLKKLVNYLL